MNQPCQRFPGRPQPSRTPGTTFVYVVLFLDPGLARGYERDGCIAVTGDRASTFGAVGPPGAKIEPESTSCPGRAPAESVAGIATSDRSALKLPSTGRTQARGGARLDGLDRMQSVCARRVQALARNESPHRCACGGFLWGSAIVSRSCAASMG